MNIVVPEAGERCIILGNARRGAELFTATLLWSVFVAGVAKHEKR